MITKQWFEHSFLLRILFILACLFCTSMMTSWGAEDEFLAPEQAFQYELISNEDGTLTLHWDIAPNYYLYRKRLLIEALDKRALQVNYPAGEIIADEFFGESEVYYNEAILTIKPNGAKSLQVRWQGCAEAGLCYPPQSAVIHLDEMLGKDEPSTLVSALVANHSATMLPVNKSPSSSQESQTSTPDKANTRANASGNNEVGEKVSDEEVSVTAKQLNDDNALEIELAQDQQLAGQLASHSLWLNLAIFFGLGLLLSFTPCVLPMIPILSSVIVGAQARKMRAFTLSLAFVIAMALTYALIGVIAALAGASVQATLQQPAFIVPLVIIFIVLALSMFGLYELQLPSFIRQRLNKLNSAQQGGSLLGASIMGIFSALLASPCMTAPLAGTLIYIADTGNALYGGLTLLLLGLGMGAPLILMATVGSVLLPKPGVWMNEVKAIFGFILLGTAIWFLSRLIDAPLHLALWGAWLVAFGGSIYLSRFRIDKPTAWDNILLIASALLCIWGGIMMVGAAGGGKSFTQPLSVYHGGQGQIDNASSIAHLPFAPIDNTAQLEQNLAQAQQQGRWTLVDFYADWCVSCKVIESQVFTDPEVAAVMGKMTLLRADVTDYDEDDKNLMSSLNVLAPPSILLFDPQGNEIRARRVVGELTAREFLDHLPTL